MSVEADAVIAGRYRLQARIATGGMGEVWRATDDRLGRPVAIKILKAQYADDERFLDRFRAEARHMAGLDHPGIARLYDYGEDADVAYLVMELVDGETLSALLAREQRLSFDRALDIAAQVGYALHAAHEAGVIHRDVKPGNILVTPTGTVKVTDFGIARATAAAAVTQTGMVLGTAHYLSPEQASGKPVTPASDVYSLGVVIYECVSGHRPYDGDTPVSIAAAHLYSDPQALPDDVPRPIVALLEQAMTKEPEDRFRSALAFARAAETVRGGLAGEPTRPLAAATLVDETTVMPAAGGAAAVPVASRSGFTRWAMLVGSLALVLFVLLLALSGDEPAGQRPAGATSPTPSPPRTTAPALIAVPRTLVGDDWGSVSAALEALRLTPVRVNRTSDAEPGTVIEISPLTGLRPGQQVTVVVSQGDDDDDDDDGKGNGKGKGRGKG